MGVKIGDIFGALCGGYKVYAISGKFGTGWNKGTNEGYVFGVYAAIIN